MFSWSREKWKNHWPITRQPDAQAGAMTIDRNYENSAVRWSSICGYRSSSSSCARTDDWTPLSTPESVSPTTRIISCRRYRLAWVSSRSRPILSTVLTKICQTKNGTSTLRFFLNTFNQLIYSVKFREHLHTYCFFESLILISTSNFINSIQYMQCDGRHVEKFRYFFKHVIFVLYKYYVLENFGNCLMCIGTVANFTQNPKYIHLFFIENSNCFDYPPYWNSYPGFLNSDIRFIISNSRNI